MLPQTDTPYPTFVLTEDNTWTLQSFESLPKLASLCGSISPKLSTHWLMHTLNAMPQSASTTLLNVDPNMLIHYLYDVQASSPTEALLALNIFALQEQSFRLHKRLATATDLQSIQGYTNCVSKLSNAMAKQAEALAKIKGKAGNTFLQQVNVNEGGQAVVHQG